MEAKRAKETHIVAVRARFCHRAVRTERQRSNNEDSDEQAQNHAVEQLRNSHRKSEWVFRMREAQREKLVIVLRK